MRTAAFAVALFAHLLLAGCGGSEITEVQPASMGATEPERPVGD